MLNKTSDITLALNTLIEKGYKINEDGSIAPPAAIEQAKKKRAENLVLAREARLAILAQAKTNRVAAIHAIHAVNDDATGVEIASVLGVSLATIYKDMKIAYPG